MGRSLVLLLAPGAAALHLGATGQRAPSIMMAMSEAEARAAYFTKREQKPMWGAGVAMAPAAAPAAGTDEYDVAPRSHTSEDAGKAAYFAARADTKFGSSVVAAAPAAAAPVATQAASQAFEDAAKAAYFAARADTRFGQDDSSTSPAAVPPASFVTEPVSAVASPASEEAAKASYFAARAETQWGKADAESFPASYIAIPIGTSATSEDAAKASYFAARAETKWGKMGPSAAREAAEAPIAPIAYEEAQAAAGSSSDVLGKRDSPSWAKGVIVPAGIVEQQAVEEDTWSTNMRGFV